MEKAFAVLFVFTMVILTGCSGGSGLTAVASSPVFAISGKATLNGNGLGGVAVLLSGPSGTSASTIQTLSDGTFTFSSLNNGSYTLSATLAGYSMSSSQTVAVNGADVSSVNFTGTTGTTGQWQQISSVPAAITVLAVDPTNSQNIYLGADGNVFKSIDGGTSWSASSGWLSSPTVGIGALVIDPTNSQNIYVGTIGNGLFKSTDGDVSWTAINSGIPDVQYYNTQELQSISSLAIDPTNSQNIYVCCDNGVFKSTNGGSSWTAISSGIANLGVGFLVIDPTNSQNVYVIVLGGVWKSTNGGALWTAISGIPNVTPTSMLEISNLAIDPTNSQNILVGTRGLPGTGGVCKSTNGGTSWTAISSGIANLGVWFLAIDPTNSQNAYVVTEGGVGKSTNGGASWTNSGFPAATATINGMNATPTVGSMTIDPNNGNVYVGTYSGAVYRLSNF